MIRTQLESQDGTRAHAPDRGQVQHAPAPSIAQRGLNPVLDRSIGMAGVGYTVQRPSIVAGAGYAAARERISLQHIVVGDAITFPDNQTLGLPPTHNNRANYRR